ncbi:MAG: diguanylate cyclase [Lachnospiraceae bacterium]|nr:diguanylate cyclase [Lachnospiraceae bacterium]
MDDKNKKGGLRKRLILNNIAPILVMGIVTTFFVYIIFNKAMTEEMEDKLHAVAASAAVSLDLAYPGDYGIRVINEEEYVLQKGNKDLDEGLAIITRLKEETSVDLTLFCKDVRQISTIQDKSGKTIDGTVVNKAISDAVILEGREMFYDNADLGGEEYFACYYPIFNSNGEVFAMISAGRTTTQMRQELIFKSLPVIGISLVMMLLAVLASTMLASEFSQVIDKEKNFLEAVAGGNLRADLDARILGRKDELGEIGKFMISVQKYIRDMIEKDALTKVYTRRIGEAKIKAVRENALEYGTHFCIAMGDIDFFKKFNDEYGHDCGDLVLSETAAVFNRMMFGNGFAVRWGGEEFILIFDNMEIDEALAKLSDIRKAVIDNAVEYEGELLTITMTFGLISGDDRIIDKQIKDVDDLLYEGKTGGRNRIVYKKDDEMHSISE